MGKLAKQCEFGANYAETLTILDQILPVRMKYRRGEAEPVFHRDRQDLVPDC